MRNVLVLNIIILFTATSPLWACEESSHIKDSQQGEYYEYDLIGSPRDQRKREAKYHTKQVLKAPFKFVGKCYRTTKGAVKGTIHSIELFLSDSRSINGRRQDFKKALSDFDANAAFNDYYVHDLDKEDAHCMFGLPTALWKLFKNVIYTAGFRFPRATWHGMKSIFLGGCTCVNG